jgi:hypothetical protein
MTVLGFSLLKNELRYSVLSGTKAKPVLVKKERILTPDPFITPQLMDWFDTNFSDIIRTEKPDIISYKLSLKIVKDQFGYLTFPLGVLNLVSKKANVPIIQYSSMAIRASKLGIKGKVDIYSFCDTTFGKNPPYWDKDQKDSLLVAWFEL